MIIHNINTRNYCKFGNFKKPKIYVVAVATVLIDNKPYPGFRRGRQLAVCWMFQHFLTWVVCSLFTGAIRAEKKVMLYY